jgi:hypothetical protein
MDHYRVHSVALLLLDGQGALYCVQELQSKPAIGKVVGSKDYSFPWETVEPDERLLRTLHRLIIEEVDVTDRVRISFPVSIGCVPVYDTLAHVFVARFEAGPEGMRGFHAGIEIEPLGWQTREFLLSRCRDGVPEVLALLDQYEQDSIACGSQ